MQQPQIDTRRRIDDEADEQAQELARALQYAAEHAGDELWTEAERREMERAA